MQDGDWYIYLYIYYWGYIRIDGVINDSFYYLLLTIGIPIF